jgi:hypothetical protein
VRSGGGLVDSLEAQTGQSFSGDLNAWRRWVWSLPYEPYPDHGAFKGALYSEYCLVSWTAPGISSRCAGR